MTQPAPTTGGDVLASQGFEAWLREAGCSLVLASSDGTRLLAVGVTEEAGSDGEERGPAMFSCEVTDANASAIRGDGEVLWTAGRGRMIRWMNGDPLYVQGALGPAGFYPRRVSFFGQSVARAIRLDAERNAWVSTTHRTAMVRTNGTLEGAKPPPTVAGSKAPPIPLQFDGTRPTAWQVERDENTAILFDDRELVIAGPRVVGLTPHGDGWLCVRPTTCEFGRVDAAGQFTAITTVPGLPTSLALHGSVALVSTTSEVTDEGALAVLKAKDIEPRASVAILDIDTGRSIHWLRWLRVVKGVGAVTTLAVPRPILVGMSGL
jgi:hypothetical protein